MNILKKIGEFYLFIVKKWGFFLNKKILNDELIKKEKRNFEKRYRIEPNDDDIKEIKRIIVMRKGLLTFLIFMLVMFCIKMVGGLK